MGVLDTIFNWNNDIKQGVNKVKPYFNLSHDLRWEINGLNKDVHILHNVPSDIDKALPKPIQNNPVTKGALNTFNFIAPSDLSTALLFGFMGGDPETVPAVEGVENVAEDVGKKYLPTFLKSMALKSAKLGSLAASFRSLQDWAQKNYKGMPSDIAANFAIGGTIGALSDIVPEVYSRVMQKIHFKAGIDKITPDFLKVLSSKVGDELNRIFNIFGKNNEAYKIVLENENNKFMAHYAASSLLDSIEDNSGAVMKIGGDTNVYNALPQAFKDGLFSKDLEDLKTEFNLNDDDIKQVENIRARFKELNPYLKNVEEAHATVSDNLKNYSKTSLKIIAKEKRVLTKTQLKLADLFKQAKQIGDVGVKGVNSLENTINRFMAIKAKIDDPLNSHIDEAKANNLLDKLLTKIQTDTDNLAAFTDKKLTATINAKNGLSDTVASKQANIWAKMGNIAKKADDLLSKSKGRLTIPFNEYYSMADNPLNALKLRTLEPENLIAKKALTLNREDAERQLTNTWTHSPSILAIKKLDKNLATKEINENYWAAKLSKRFNIPVKELRDILKGLPQATDSRPQLFKVVEQRLMNGGVDNAQNIAINLIDNIYDTAGMSEGLTAQQMIKAGELPLFMQDNPLLKYYHDKTMNPVYDYLTGNENQINNFLDKMATGIKRFRVGLIPTYHMFSETKSALFSGKSLSSIKDVLMLNKEDFNKYMLDMYGDTKAKLDAKGVPLMTYLDRPVTYSKENSGKIAKVLLGNKYMQATDRLLWSRMYPAYKLAAAHDVADDLADGLIDAKTAEYRLNVVNSFFGGLPELALKLPPATKTAIRNIMFAPDWGLSLLKQMGYALSGNDIMAAKYYSNMLAYNIFIRQAFQLYTGQNNSLTQLQHEKSPDAIYSTMGNVGGHPVNFNVLGYEKEYPSTIYDILNSFHEGGMTAGAREAFYKLGSKLGVLPGIVYNAGEVMAGHKPLINLLSPVAPFALSDIIQKPKVSSIVPSLLSSSLGITATSLNKSKALTDIILSPQPINSSALKVAIDEINKDFAGYKKPKTALQNAIALNVLEHIDYYYPEKLAEMKYQYALKPTKQLANQIKIFQENFKKAYIDKYNAGGFSYSKVSPTDVKIFNAIHSYYLWGNIKRVLDMKVKDDIDKIQRNNKTNIQIQNPQNQQYSNIAKMIEKLHKEEGIGQ